MSYKLQFIPSSLKEWKKLDNSIKQPLKKKLAEVLTNPHIPGNRLHGFKDVYKIKLRSADYRLVYKVIDKKVCVVIIAIAKREKNMVYSLLKNRVIVK